jgi:hypothetical protein
MVLSSFLSVHNPYRLTGERTDTLAAPGFFSYSFGTELPTSGTSTIRTCTRSLAQETFAATTKKSRCREFLIKSPGLKRCFFCIADGSGFECKLHFAFVAIHQQSRLRVPSQLRINGFNLMYLSIGDSTRTCIWCLPAGKRRFAVWFISILQRMPFVRSTQVAIEHQFIIKPNRGLSSFEMMKDLNFYVCSACSQNRSSS